MTFFLLKQYTIDTILFILKREDEILFDEVKTKIADFAMDKAKTNK